MNKNYLLLIVVATVLFSSCDKDKTVAAFTTDKKSYIEGETVKFTNNSANAESYKWDFDIYNELPSIATLNTESSEENPTMTYNYPGEYTVRLIANSPTFSASTLSSYDQIIKVYSNASVNYKGVWQGTYTKTGNDGVVVETKDITITIRTNEFNHEFYINDLVPSIEIIADDEVSSFTTHEHFHEAEGASGEVFAGTGYLNNGTLNITLTYTYYTQKNIKFVGTKVGA